MASQFVDPMNFGWIFPWVFGKGLPVWVVIQSYQGKIWMIWGSMGIHGDPGSLLSQFFEVFKQQTKLALNDYGEMQCRGPKLIFLSGGCESWRIGSFIQNRFRFHQQSKIVGLFKFGRDWNADSGRITSGECLKRNGFISNMKNPCAIVSKSKIPRCLSLSLSIYLSIYLPTYLRSLIESNPIQSNPIYLSIYLSVYLYRSIHPSIYLSIYQSIYLSQL